MKNPIRTLTAGIAGLGLALSIGGAAMAQQVSLATGGVSGVYYPLGGAMAEAWSAEVDGLTATAESTGASVVNVRLIQGAEAEIAMVQNDIAYYAFNGDEMFEGEALDKNLGLAMLYPEVIQIVTLADRDISTVDDLSGMRVAVGAPGSGTEANARQILGVHGISYDDINEQFLPFGEAVDALRDGSIDAAFLTAGIPTAAVIDLDATHDFALVSISSDRAAELEDQYPFYTAFTIPGDTYGDLEGDVETVTVQAMLVVSADMDADVVENMLSILFDDATLERLCDTHVRGCDVSLDTALDGMPIDLHPGAEAFYNNN
ncbi:TAXI family TRAP transporter solute-binding subunit [Chelativorans sp. ZYF759]|uniref:TAXI family TRAP transporter solute-binding subunit n=1 Tax=Chelativorans sp. ZYF759 TaxID=2692213 RepID=UPI00145DD9C4|nr:TAXI family TRAP transporter solute-binding subunit [Chelativorans sp. ZYF759]NMG40433.1 TAXI family TRAP transporter solute-binding subunit [Chelativorans sp. ZYF759]